MMRIIMLLTFIIANIATDKTHSTRISPKYQLKQKTINNLRECKRQFKWFYGLHKLIRYSEKKIDVRSIPFVSTPIVCNPDTYNSTMRTIVEDALLLYTFM